jgi:hypothetical protein
MCDVPPETKAEHTLIIPIALILSHPAHPAATASVMSLTAENVGLRPHPRGDPPDTLLLARGMSLRYLSTEHRLLPLSRANVEYHQAEIARGAALLARRKEDTTIAVASSSSYRGVTFGPEIRLQRSNVLACGSGETVAPARPGSNPPDSGIVRRIRGSTRRGEHRPRRPSERQG